MTELSSQSRMQSPMYCGIAYHRRQIFVETAVVYSLNDGYLLIVIAVPCVLRTSLPARAISSNVGTAMLGVFLTNTYISSPS